MTNVKDNIKTFGKIKGLFVRIFGTKHIAWDSDSEYICTIESYYFKGHTYVIKETREKIMGDSTIKDKTIIFTEKAVYQKGIDL